MNQKTKRALLIGINYYNSSSELSGCVNDVEDVQKYLQHQDFTDFSILTDSEDDPYNELSTAPTRDNIINAMRKIVAATLPGDTLFVHYSGHGSQLDDQSDGSDADEFDGEDECICPVDCGREKFDKGYIRDDDLRKILVDNLVEGAKLRVFFDACHSGSALDLPYMWKQGTRFNVENEINHGTKDIIFISGCSDRQTSADSRFRWRDRGAFTWSLLKSLKKIHRAKCVYLWEDLIDLMRLRLKKYKYDQVPQISVISMRQIKTPVDI